MDSAVSWLNTNWSHIVSALAGGGVVTAWKWLTGWQNVNLSIQLEIRRTPSDTLDEHDAVCLVKLKKGDRATLRLESIIFTTKIGSKMPVDHDIDLLITTPAKDRKLNLTPGEEAHFAIYLKVPSKELCSVSVTVLGRSISGKGRLGVWRGSDVSVPYLKETKAADGATKTAT